MSSSKYIIFLKCDLDQLQKLSNECQISAIPTFQGFSSFTSTHVTSTKKNTISGTKDQKNILVKNVGCENVLENENDLFFNNPVFGIVGRKEKELVLKVGSLVEKHLRKDKISRFDLKSIKPQNSKSKIKTDSKRSSNEEKTKDFKKTKSDESERRFESGIRGRGFVREGEGTVAEVPCEEDVGERCGEGMEDQCGAICSED